ncbi:MAG: hypothetical protein R3B90_23310 [Planctomycetaceae bacterium]
MRPALRLFTGELDDSIQFETPSVSMTFGELFEIVSEATRYRRSWLKDFQDDEVQLPVDLYEVLSAYWSLKPGA